MSDPAPPRAAEGSPRAAFYAVLLIVGGMGCIVVGGAVALAFVSPEFVDATLSGLAGEGEGSGILLFGVQLFAFFALTFGLLAWTWRKGQPAGRGDARK